MAHPHNGTSYTIPGQIGIWKCCFLRGGKHHLGYPSEQRRETNHKLYPHMLLTAGLEPRPHWWEASTGVLNHPLLSK